MSLSTDVFQDMARRLPRSAIVFIGSDKASYIVGASLAVDGGMLAG